MRLFLVTTITAITLFIIYLTILFWGKGLPHREYKTDYFDSLNRPFVALPWHQIENSNTELIRWVTITKNSHDVLVTQSSDNQEIELAKLIQKNSNSRWIFDIQANIHNVDRQIAEIVKINKIEERVIISSPHDVVIRATRELLPITLTGASQSDALRFISFNSLFLLPAAPFKGDVFITPLKWRSVDLISEEIVLEIHRRKKYLIVGPLNSAEDIKLAQRRGAKSFFLGDKSLLMYVSEK